MSNPFALMKKREYALMICSAAAVLLTAVLSRRAEPLTPTATLIGSVMLVFLAVGSVWGQILTVVFSILYGIISARCAYWGEMITYLGMTMPMAVMAAVQWIKNPDSSGLGRVETAEPDKKQILVMTMLCAAVTAVFGGLLYAFHTPNLFFSVISVSTSFLAVYLTYLRSPFYALAYAANDIVLIVLWMLMSREDMSYLTMAVNFMIFLVNDLYGFVSWKQRADAKKTAEQKSAV